MKISPEVVETVSAKTGTIQDKLSTMGNLHSALKTTVINSHNEGGIDYILVRLQNGKDDFVETLHARPPLSRRKALVSSTITSTPSSYGARISWLLLTGFTARNLGTASCSFPRNMQIGCGQHMSVKALQHGHFKSEAMPTFCR